MKLRAALLLISLLIATAAQAGTVYVPGIPALTVGLYGDNTNAIIDLLTGIQYLLWFIGIELLGICILQWVDQFRTQRIHPH